MSSMESPRVARLHEALDQIDDAMVLLSLYEVGAYAALVDGPATAAVIAERLSLVPHRLEAFLYLAANLGLIENRDSRFYLFEGDAEFFDSANPQGTGLPTSLIQRTFRAKGRAVEILRGGAPEVAAGSGGDAGPEQRASFLRYIDAVSTDGAQELASLLPDAAVRRVIDLGGGGGTYSHAVLTRYPEAHGLIVDRPDAEPTVLALAKERGFAQRLGFAAIDFINDPLPEGNDVAILSNIVHCFSAETNRALVGRVAQSLAPGGVVAIKDYAVAADHAGPRSALLFAVSMALYSDAGSVYSADEVSGWCREAGLRQIEAHAMTRTEGSYTVVARRLD